MWNKLNSLARNWWWSWDSEATRLFKQLDPEVWEASHHSAVAVLGTVGEEGLTRRIGELDLGHVADDVLNRFGGYLSDDQPWITGKLGVQPGNGNVAYFSAEYGIQESLQIYAGGLGILAGDHCKSASDLGLPLIAVGLVYREGYFTQLIDPHGRQHAYYRRNDVSVMGLEPIVEESGRAQTFVIPGLGDKVVVCMWRTDIGRVPMILLDTWLWGNRPEDRRLTCRLYDTAGDTRIRQEILLGIGGLRALRFLGYQPSVFHMNEGHTAFLTLELIREKVRDGASFEEAVRATQEQCVFTTHTPVPAGHDRFSPELVEKYLGSMKEELGVDSRTLLGLGRVNPNDDHETFCMTVLALKMSRAANAVSQLHCDVSRKMWHCLWEERSQDDVPIRHVTNGVHISTWMAPEIGELLDAHIGKTWRTEPWKPEVWDGVEDIPDSLLWAVHLLLKRRLLDYAREQVVTEQIRNRQLRRRRELVVRAQNADVLTVGFARRFATYKRGDLFFRDLERAKNILTSPDQPVRILFAGKAHPQDFGGGGIIQNIIRATRDHVLGPHVLFLPNYDMAVAKHLVQGVDVWLNTPRRPREASGTSGQKVPLNGGINVSTIDGWWPEGYDGNNGWNIGGTDPFNSEWDQDEHDSADLYRLMETEIVPRYYDRCVDGLPRKWIKMMKTSLRTIAHAFSAKRMVRDYAHQLYWP